MRILILTPISDGAVTGNLCAGEQWRDVLLGLGHEVRLVSCVDGQSADLLIALNAALSEPGVAAFRDAQPAGRVVVVLTGTDIYPAPGVAARRAMRVADRLVALQPRAVERVPVELRDKVRVIVQAVLSEAVEASGGGGDFDVALVANLREVKDPLLVAAAARLMPPGSRLRVRHAGSVLQEGFRQRAEQESADNPRYQWLGGLDVGAARELIATSDLLVLTSRSEGAGRVIGEAIVQNVPVLATRIDGVIGLLGDDYPGLFPVGDAAALAELLRRAEGEPGFIEMLRRRCRALAAQFDPERESQGWRRLLAEIG